MKSEDAILEAIFGTVDLIQLSEERVREEKSPLQIAKNRARRQLRSFPEQRTQNVELGSTPKTFWAQISRLGVPVDAAIPKGAWRSQRPTHHFYFCVLTQIITIWLNHSLGYGRISLHTERLSN